MASFNRGGVFGIPFRLMSIIFLTISFSFLIIFPLVYSSLKFSINYAVAFIGVFLKLPLSVSHVLVILTYSVALLYLIYKTMRPKENVIYMMAEAMFISYFLSMVVEALFPRSLYPGEPEEFTKIIIDQIPSVLIAPLFEETFFRIGIIGVPLVLITRKLKYLFGKIDNSELPSKGMIIPLLLMIASSIIFGVAHTLIGGWGAGKAFVASVQGLYLSYLFVKYGFLANISLHFIINCTSAIVAWFSVSSLSNPFTAIFVGLYSILILIGSVLSLVTVSIRAVQRARALKKVIIVVGYPGAGKSEVRRIVEEVYGIKGVSMGDVVRMHAQRFDIPMNPQEVSKFADSMRRIHGMDYWARKTVEYIQDLKSERKIGKIVLIDGVRNIEEVLYFKEVFGENMVIIAVKASEELRFKRLVERGRADDVKTLEDLRMRDEIERSWGIDRVIESADYVIDNNGTLEDLRKAVIDVFDKILKD